MPSNEIKRQFTLGKMEKDKDDRLVQPGSYRDANNVDVSRSEGDDSGALQVVRGNRLPVNQDIDWALRESGDDVELTKPFGETVGTYSYPQEEKVYFFNTGRPVNPEFPDVEQPLQNAIFEYDQVNNTVSPILIETDRGDYEAGGAATQEFIGEIQETQVWGKESYQTDTEQTDMVFQYTKSPSTRDTDFSIINLTCDSSNIIERDDEDNPICRHNGECSNGTCDCNGTPVTYTITAAIPQFNPRIIIYQFTPADNDIQVGDHLTILGVNDQVDGFHVVSANGQGSVGILYDEDIDPIDYTGGGILTHGSEDCNEVLVLYEAADGEYVCRTDNGAVDGEVCTCFSGGDCDFVELPCPGDGGLSRAESSCQSAPGVISPDIDFEEKSELVLEYNDEEYNRSIWTISPDPLTQIQYQVIDNNDLSQESCTPKAEFPNFLGEDKYTLNGNGANLQPEEFCDPRCEIFQPSDCTEPSLENNFCYPDYCLKTPILDSLNDTQLTEEAVAYNATRFVTMTDVPNVGDGEIIQATLKRLVPDRTSLAASFDGVNERYNFTAPEDNGRGLFTAENAVIVRNMNALDYQQLDSIFGNVGLASRPVGYTYRVARNGAVSWIPNSDEPFQAFPNPNTDAEAVLSNVNPLDNNIPAGGEVGDNVQVLVDVDRQQEFEVDATELTKEEIKDKGIDDLTEKP